MIVLTVLKIIGIVILCILALAILILLAVLFLPLRYKISGDYDSDTKDYHLNADINWCLGILKVYGNFDKENGLDYWAKFFGKKIFPKDEDGDDDFDESEYPELTEEYYDGGSDYGKEETIGQIEERKETAEKEETAEPEEKDSGEILEKAEEKEEKENEKEPDDKIKEEKKPAGNKLIKKIRGIFDKIKGIFENIRYKTESLCDKIKGIRDKIVHYKELLEDEETKRALAKAWGETKYFAVKIKPKKLSLKVRYGAGDPSDTGITYGKYAAIKPFIGKGVCMVPDFEKKIIHADLYMKGCLRLYVLLVIACRLYFDKRFMKVVKKFKR